MAVKLKIFPKELSEYLAPYEEQLGKQNNWPDIQEKTIMAWVQKNNRQDILVSAQPQPLQRMAGAINTGVDIAKDIPKAVQTGIKQAELMGLQNRAFDLRTQARPTAIMEGAMLPPTEGPDVAPGLGYETPQIAKYESQQDERARVLKEAGVKRQEIANIKPSKASTNTKIGKAIYQGVSNLPSSMLMGGPTQIGSLAGPIGTAIGSIVTAKIAGAAEYENFIADAKDELGPELMKRTGLSKEKADDLVEDMVADKAAISAMVEGGGEALANVLFSKIMGVGELAKRPFQTAVTGQLKDKVMQFAKRPAVQAIKDLTLNAMNEAGTEFLQAGSQSVARKAAGMKALSFKEAGKEAIGPALVMSLITGGFATGLNISTSQRAILEEAQQNPTPENVEKSKNVIKAADPKRAEDLESLLTLRDNLKDFTPEQLATATDAFVTPQGKRAAQMVIEQHQKLLQSQAATERAVVEGRTAPLTGKLNRTGWKEGIPSKGIKSYAERQAEGHTIVYSDLDNFKAVNDAYGDKVGDQAIQHAAKITEQVANKYGIDTHATPMGDEGFLSVPEKVDPKVVAEDLRATMEANPFIAPDGKPFKLTMSIGIGEKGGNEEGANLAAKLSKYKGRNTISTAEEVANISPEQKADMKRRAEKGRIQDIRHSVPADWWNDMQARLLEKAGVPTEDWADYITDRGGLKLAEELKSSFDKTKSQRQAVEEIKTDYEQFKATPPVEPEAPAAPPQAEPIQQANEPVEVVKEQPAPAIQATEGKGKGITEEQYLAQNGAPFMGGAEPALHRQPGSDVKSRAKNAKPILDAMDKNNEKRNELRKEYQDKVKRGEIRQPTREENIIATANGDPANEATQAARRIADKNGIDWKSPTPALSQNAKEPWQMTKDRFVKEGRKYPDATPGRAPLERLLTPKLEAAFRDYDTDKIYRQGAIHSFDKLPKEIQKKFTDRPTETIGDEGFVDDAGKFYTRDEAVALTKSNKYRGMKLEDIHKSVVQQALASGKPVPAEVLNDYPDLKPVVAGKVVTTTEIPNKELRDARAQKVDLEKQISDYVIKMHDKYGISDKDELFDAMTDIDKKPLNELDAKYQKAADFSFDIQTKKLNRKKIIAALAKDEEIPYELADNYPDLKQQIFDNYKRHNPDISKQAAAGKGQTTLSAVENELDNNVTKEQLSVGLSIKPVGNQNPSKPYVMSNPEVENSIKQARGLRVDGILDKIKNGARRVYTSFTQHDPHLDMKEDAYVSDVLRTFRGQSQVAQARTIKDLQGFTDRLRKQPSKFETFEKYLIAEDLNKDIDSKLYDGKELPWGYKNASEVKKDLENLRQITQTDPDIKNAVDLRNKLFTAMAQEGVKYGVLPESVLDNPAAYIRHQVLKYYDLDNANRITQGGSKKLKDVKKGWQKARTGSAEAYNTNTLESDYEILHQLRQKIEVQKTRDKIKEHYNSELSQWRKDNNVTDNEAIPEGWDYWKAKPGTKWFKTEGLGDEVVNSILGVLKATKETGDIQGYKSHLTTEDIAKQQEFGSHIPLLAKQVNQIIDDAVHYQSPKDKMAIPERVIKTLDGNDYSLREEGPIGRFSRATMNRWKQYILTNPLRWFKYNANNMSGDLDVAVANDPKIMKYSNSAVSQLWNDAKGKAESPRIKDARKYGVIDAGQTIAEIKDINTTSLLAELTGKTDYNLVKKYFHNAREASSFRESVLRLASFEHFLNEIKEGKQVYGASKKVEIDQIKDPVQKAAKLSRELMGDYGNLSEGGTYLRDHLIPFYSWMEINAPRYVRILKNAGHEGKNKTGDVAKVGVIKATSFAAKKAAQALILTGLVTAWNGIFHREEEKKLSQDSRNQMHIILGSTKDGRVRTLRLQGALSDALDWFGASDIVSDIRQLKSGEKTGWEFAKETALSPAKRIIGSVRPDIKLFAELLTKKKLYPDPFHPTPIRDLAQHALGTVSGDIAYRYATGKPTRPLKQELTSAFTYETDPGEAAYNDITSTKYDWLEKMGKSYSGGEPTDRANALYYYKQSMRYDNKDKAKKYYDKYKELGGTEKSIGESLARMTPLGGISKEDTDKLIETLSPEKVKLFERAYDWYMDNMLEPEAKKYIDEQLAMAEPKGIKETVKYTEKAIRHYYRIQGIEAGEIHPKGKTFNPNSIPGPRMPSLKQY